MTYTISDHRKLVELLAEWRREKVQPAIEERKRLVSKKLTDKKKKKHNIKPT
jgi:hypothetical protein